jgi:molybdopterin-synthase adenylyltransferase
VSAPDSPRKLRCFPVQFVQTDDSVRLRRGCVDLRISGEHAVEIVQRVLEAATGAGATREEICQSFPAPERATVLELLGELEKRQILSYADAQKPTDALESPVEIFFWHFGRSTKEVSSHLTAQHIAILGVNEISRNIALALSETNIENIEIVDDPLLRNLKLFDNESRIKPDLWKTSQPLVPLDSWTMSLPGCLVATCDFGGVQLMNRWNKFCLEGGCHFLPVVLQDLIGYVGPLVIPGETACYECLNARWNSNAEEPEPRRTTIGFEEQHFVGFHPSMAAVLGAVTVFELSKFYGLEVPFAVVGRLLEINLLTMKMEARKVLRIPRCPACSNLYKRSSTSLMNGWFGFSLKDEA